jgi:predicted nucleic acid-binding protein
VDVELIYSVAENDPRSDAAEALLAGGGVISADVLNEFVAVARRKLGMSWADVTEALDAIRILCPSRTAKRQHNGSVPCQPC